MKRRDVVCMWGVTLTVWSVPIPGLAGMVLATAGAACSAGFLVALWRAKRDRS